MCVHASAIEFAKVPDVTLPQQSIDQTRGWAAVIWNDRMQILDTVRWLWSLCQSVSILCLYPVYPIFMDLSSASFWQRTYRGAYCGQPLRLSAWSCSQGLAGQNPIFFRSPRARLSQPHTTTMILPHQFRRSLISRLVQARNVSSSINAFPRTVASLLVRSNWTPNPHVDHDIGVTKSSSDHDDDASQIVTVHGWVRSVRRMKTVSFVHVADGSTTIPLQAVLTGEQSEG